MKTTSRGGKGLRALAIGALASAGVAVAALPAWADMCFSGHHINEPQDAGQRDGATVGTRGGGARHRVHVGTGLVLVAGLGGAWLGGRRKKDGGDDHRDGGDGDGGAASLR
ncbi:MAG TPA: hypothetical protein VKZ18_21520 [Polyangia bacterium]|nr:hypothetical protein [Polyangia bacterium]